MNNYVKIKAKQLLYKNTLRLFFTSLLSFVFRLGAFALIILAPPAFINTGLFKILCDYTGMTAGVTISVILYLLLTIGLLCFASGIWMGEKKIYLQQLNGVKSKLRYLFKYLSPRKSIRALNLYTKTILLKVMWVFYFLIPPALCFGCSLYLISRRADNITVFITSLAGSVLLSASIVLLNSVFFRYSQGVFYMCTHKNATSRESLNFSIAATDGHLNDSTVLYFSLIGWILSCVFIVPVFYTVPYIKLCKVAFMEECRHIPVSKTDYAVNILEIHPNI